LNDTCGICGAEDGDLMYCEGGEVCTAAVHAKYLGSRQVFKFEVFKFHVVHVLHVVQLSYNTIDAQIYSELGARSMASGDANCAKCKKSAPTSA
jgi:hypothetical protein